MSAPNSSRGKGYPFPRLLVFPQTPNVNFFEIYKTPSAWLFLFLECRFIILYINFTTKNKTTFDKIFSQKIFYIPKILQKKISLSHKK